jgi:uncharacterized integral membrane protein
MTSDDLPPVWVSKIDRFLITMAHNWVAIVVGIILLLCLYGAVAEPTPSPTEGSAGGAD